MAKTQYQSVWVVTEKDLKKAERLKNRGWIIYSVGLNLIKFYKKAKD